MPFPAMTTVNFNHRSPHISTAALVIGFAIATSCHVGFVEAHPSDNSGSLTDGRRVVWVLESGAPPSPLEDSLLDVGASKHKRSQNSANSMGMWFGPRLGRRRRSISESDLNGAESGPSNMASSGSGDYGDDIAFASLFREAPWSLRELQQRAWLNMPDRSESSDDRRLVNFTPRLGRESGEELVDNHGIAPPPPPAPPAPVQLAAALRSPPFAPRLGRGLLFSPRMGRSSAPAAPR